MAAQGWTPVPDTSAWKPVQEQKGFLKSFDEQTGISQLAKHPIDTLLGIPSGLVAEAKRSYGEAKAALNATDPLEQQKHATAAVPFIGKGIIEGGKQVDEGNPSGAAGTLAGIIATTVGPEIAGDAAKVAPKVAKAVPGVIRATGEAAQDAAGGRINLAAGTLKSDFKRGANPGRGYLAEGGGVASSMKDLATKARTAVSDVGDRIGTMYKQADATGQLIPVQMVYKAIADPLKDAYDIATGPGAPEGLAKSLEHHADTFKATLQKGVQNGGFTPSEVWDLKQRIAKATNWSDATNLGMKQIRQQQVGQLSGVLKDAVPGLADANQSYMDLLKLAGRAEERAATGSQPLTGHMRDIGTIGVAGLAGEGLHGGAGAVAAALAAKAARSIPGRTAAATGLYKAGSGLMSVADRIEALTGKTNAAPSVAQTVVSNPVGQQVVSPPPQSIRITKIKKVVP